MKRYLIDTSVWINGMRALPQNAEAASFLSGVLSSEEDEVAFNTVILTELYKLISPAEQKVIDGVISELIFLPDNQEIALCSAARANALRRSGKTLPTLDILIAEQAKYYGVTLVSLDKHFLEIEGLDLEYFPYR